MDKHRIRWTTEKGNRLSTSPDQGQLAAQNLLRFYAAEFACSQVAISCGLCGGSATDKTVTRTSRMHRAAQINNSPCPLNSENRGLKLSERYHTVARLIEALGERKAPPRQAV